MTAANVTSHHDAPLPLPGGTLLRPGATARVENWDVVKAHPTVKAWLAANAISADLIKANVASEPTKRSARKKGAPTAEKGAGSAS
ncbi:hypothetical protein L0F51_00230 [Afifella sp. H1R]|uniref:hypothetical protein n=1 Tax=Afifella sp. H1R TaxID=2908841 RepID=UPI001F315539|nr:hypothetical protein [Afifella sp. H1R]MCF1502191.1 hypothetical protein [Afifella sp. H1R]